MKQFNTLSPRQQASTFIHAIFNENEVVWTTSFTVSPTARNAGWEGKGQKLNCKEFPIRVTGRSAYYCPTAFTPEANSRKKEYITRVAAIVLDDVFEDYELPLPPSYLLETSPGNHQAGYIITDGYDFALAESILRAASKQGWADASGNNVVRYVRVPGGINTKEGKNKFPSNMKIWRPERKFTLAQLANAFGTEATDVDYTGSDSFGGYDYDEVKSLLWFMNEPGRSDSWGKYASGVNKSIDGYDFFRDMVFALHESGVPGAKELGLEWANNRDKADGGKAFLRTWRAADKNEAKKGHKITLRTFFGYAKAEGWEYIPPTGFEPDFELIETTADDTAEIIQEIPEVLGITAAMLKRTADYWHYSFMLWGAVSIISMLIGRKACLVDQEYEDQDHEGNYEKWFGDEKKDKGARRTFCNQYYTFIAPAATGKEVVLALAKAYAEGVKDKEEILVITRIASAVGLEEAVLARPATISILDEVNAGKESQKEITSVTNELYSAVNGSYVERFKKGSGGTAVANPFYMQISASTEDTHFDLDRTNAVALAGGGNLRRTLYISVAGNPDLDKHCNNSVIQPYLHNVVKDWHSSMTDSYRGNKDNIEDMGAGTEFKPITVQMPNSLWKILRAHRRKIHKELMTTELSSEHKQILKNHILLVKKFALILTMANPDTTRETAVVDEKSLRLAIKMAENYERLHIGVLKGYMARSSAEKEGLRLLEKLQDVKKRRKYYLELKGIKNTPVYVAGLKRGYIPSVPILRSAHLADGKAAKAWLKDNGYISIGTAPIEIDKSQRVEFIVLAPDL